MRIKHFYFAVSCKIPRNGCWQLSKTFSYSWNKGISCLCPYTFMFDVLRTCWQIYFLLRWTVYTLSIISRQAYGVRNISRWQLCQLKSIKKKIMPGSFFRHVLLHRHLFCHITMSYKKNPIKKMYYQFATRHVQIGDSAMYFWLICDRPIHCFGSLFSRSLCFWRTRV